MYKLVTSLVFMSRLPISPDNASVGTIKSYILKIANKSMLYFFKNIIDTQVDKRVSELVNDSNFIEFKDMSQSKVDDVVSNFLSAKREEGIETISTLDLVLKLRIPAQQIENTLERFKKDRKLRELSYVG